MRGVVGAIALWLGLAGCAFAEPSTARLPTVAIPEFDYGAVRVQWPTPTLDDLDVGRGIASLLAAEVANGGAVRLVERQRAADVMRENSSGGSLPAQYVVIGTVTKFGGEQKTRAAGGIATSIAGFATGHPLLGMVKLKDTHAYVDLSFRIVKAATGEILSAANVTGRSRRRGLLLGGLGGRHSIAGAALSVESADFQATLLGEATTMAVKNAADKLRALLAAVS